MILSGFYREGERRPVQEYLEDLRRQGHRRKALARLIADLDILGQEGLRSSRISVRSLGDGLWELRRAFQRVSYRILFCVAVSAIWLLHAFEKETRKTPLNDLELGRARMRKVLERRRQDG